jgi:hypothetical protein
MRMVKWMGIVVVLASACSSTTSAPDVRDAATYDKVIAADGARDGQRAERTIDLTPDKPKLPARWEQVPSASLKMERHTATLLKDGRVLIVGGRISGSAATKEVHVYLPDKNLLQTVAPMQFERWGHSATLLKDGRVLVAGGSGSGSSTTYQSTEVFEPVANTWSPGPDLPSPRALHRAVLLASGDVLIAGGVASGLQLKSFVIYQTGSNAFKQLTTSMTTKRAGLAMLLLKDSKVVLVGGFGGTDGKTYLDTLEVFDPATEAATAIAAKMSDKRNFPTATLLPNGEVLIVGGEFCDSTCQNTSSDDLYDPTKDKITGISHVGVPPAFHAASALADGRVLITGGIGQSDMSKVVIFDPAGSGAWVTAPSLLFKRYQHTSTTLLDGSVLVVGGTVTDWTYVEQVERFYP